MQKGAPTKGNLLKLKKTRTLAHMGQTLMDRKKNILTREMLLLVPKVSKIRHQISETFSRAYMALQEANITLGVVGEISKSIPIDSSLKITYRNVMGVDIPTIKHDYTPHKLSYGLRSTNSKFDYAYQMFQKARDLMVELAAIDNAIYSLANAIRRSQKRSNALKNVVIPNLESHIKDINNILEEHEREEFVRLKVLKGRL